MELWHSSSYNTSIRMSPFMALYGREAPSLPSYTSGMPHLAAVDSDLSRHQQILHLVQVNMEKAQVHMKRAAEGRQT